MGSTLDSAPLVLVLVLVGIPPFGRDAFRFPLSAVRAVAGVCGSCRVRGGSAGTAVAVTDGAEEAVGASAAADSPAAPPAGTLVTLETARSVNALVSLDLAALDLPPPLVEALESNGLLVPSALSDDEQDGLLGAAGAGAALLFALPLFEIGLLGDLALSSALGGGLATYAALRADAAGDAVRKGGRLANRGALGAARTAKQINDKYELVDTAKAKAAQAARALTEAIKERIGS